MDKTPSYKGKGIVDSKSYVPTDKEREMVEWLQSLIPFETRHGFLFPNIDMTVVVNAVGYDDKLIVRYGERVLTDRGENSQRIIKFARKTFDKYADGCYGFYVDYKDIVKLREGSYDSI